MIKKPFSIEFNMRLKNFKFKKESCLRGDIILSKQWKKKQFKYYLNTNACNSLINNRERKIEFHFTLEMHPDFGEISFDGECILESLEQNKIQFGFVNKIPPFIQLVDRIILKQCYKNSKRIAEINKIPFPPVDILMRFPIKK